MILKHLKILAFLTEVKYHRDIVKYTGGIKYNKFNKKISQKYIDIISANLDKYTDILELVKDLRYNYNLGLPVYLILVCLYRLDVDRKDEFRGFMLNFVERPLDLLRFYSIYTYLFGKRIPKSLKKLISLILYRFRDDEICFLDDTIETGLTFKDMLLNMDKKFDYPLPKYLYEVIKQNIVIHPEATPLFNQRKMFCKEVDQAFKYNIVFAKVTKEILLSQGTKQILDQDLKTYLALSLNYERLLLNLDYILKSDLSKYIISHIIMRLHGYRKQYVNPLYLYMAWLSLWNHMTSKEVSVNFYKIYNSFSELLLRSIKDNILYMKGKSTILVDVTDCVKMCEYPYFTKEDYLGFLLYQLSLSSDVEIKIKGASSRLKHILQETIQNGFINYVDTYKDLFSYDFDMSTSRVILLNSTKGLEVKYLDKFCGGVSMLFPIYLMRIKNEPKIVKYVDKLEVYGIQGVLDYIVNVLYLFEENKSRLHLVSTVNKFEQLHLFN